MSTTLKDYFASWDPMRFIAEGAPTEEYDQEASEVASKFRPTMDEGELAALIHDIFVDSMGIDPEGFAEDCLRHAPEIRKVLIHQK